MRYQGLFRVGDRMGWHDEKFSVLASDQDLIIRNDQWGHGSHPDKEIGKWAQVSLQDGAIGVPDLAAGPTGRKATLTRWQGDPATRGHERGPVDMNFAHQDGSVKRIDDVSWDASTSDKDERVSAVPMTSNGAGLVDGYHFTLAPD